MTKHTPTPMRRHWRRALAISTAALVSSVAQPAAWATVAPQEDVGDVAIVDANDQRTVVDHGDSDDVFSLRLPDGSTCPGDSVNDQWRTQSFIIPIADDPIGIRYGAIGPEPVGNGRYAMFMADTRPYVHQLTRPNPGAGQPGVISAIPPLSFAVVAGEQIPPGLYRIGIACTYFGATAKYWDTEIVITASYDDQPGLLAWRLADVPAGDTETAHSSNRRAVLVFAGMAAGGMALAVVGSCLWRNRSRRLTTFSKETQ